MAFSPRPVVDAQHTRSVNQSRWSALMNLSQQRRAARQQTQTLCQSRASSTAQGKREPAQRLARPAAPSAIASHRTRQRFGKHLAPATGLHAEEPPRLETDYHRNTVPRQIGQPPHIPAMHLLRRRSARWQLVATRQRPQPHLDRPGDAAKADQLDFRNYQGPAFLGA